MQKAIVWSMKVILVRIGRNYLELSKDVVGPHGGLNKGDSLGAPCIQQND